MPVPLAIMAAGAGLGAYSGYMGGKANEKATKEAQRAAAEQYENDRRIAAMQALYGHGYQNPTKQHISDARNPWMGAVEGGMGGAMLGASAGIGLKEAGIIGGESAAGGAGAAGAAGGSQGGYGYSGPQQTDQNLWMQPESTKPYGHVDPQYMDMAPSASSYNQGPTASAWEDMRRANMDANTKASIGPYDQRRLSDYGHLIRRDDY